MDVARLRCAPRMPPRPTLSSLWSHHGPYGGGVTSRATLPTGTHGPRALVVARRRWIASPGAARRSSTPTPTRPRPWPPTRSCPSSRRSPAPRASRWRPGTSPSPGRILASFPEHLTRGAADPRRPGRARRAGQDARGQHHQAAERQRVDPAAQGRHRRAAGQGLRPPRLPRRARRATTSATSGPATTRSRAAPSTRCSARATPTAGPRPR